MSFTKMNNDVGEVTIREYQADKHAGLLSAWLVAPHIKKWWGETTLVDALDARSDGAWAIIQVSDFPVGFIRWHTLNRRELDDAGLNEIPDGGIDLDILIGEEKYLNQGLGSYALGMTVEILQGRYSPPFFSVCTEVVNERALHCYRKVEFSIVRSFKEGEKQYYFLRREPSVSC